MSYIAEHRKYKRSNNAIYKAEMSADRVHWQEIDLWDVSAGGLKFSQKDPVNIDFTLYFRLSVYNVFSEFNMELEGHIVRSERENNTFRHGVKFDNVDEDKRVQLDEVIKSSICSDDISQNTPEDGIYAFWFMHKPRHKKLHIY